MKYWILGMLLITQVAFSRNLAITAHRLEEPLEVDGKLIEKFYLSVAGIDSFIQQQPIENALPTEKTIVWISYDAKSLYVSAQLYDSHPDSIIALLGRRDSDMNSDLFLFAIDPYYDRRSGYYFGVSAAGTVYDGILYNDNWTDDSWDGVWESAVSRNPEGWSLEMRIPFSQLRFKKSNQYLWAFNCQRVIQRRNEQDLLVITPRNESGVVSRFLDLQGIENIDTRRQVEFLPYARLKGEYLDGDNGNPFYDGSRYLPGIGADLKVAIGNNLTFDATINPDFGQVEVDPAVINLSDVETYYSEKRPFFIEGSQIFGFGSGGATSYWNINFNKPTMFYSRRIGAKPRGSLPDHDYASVPDGTSILAAGKLTGKAGQNWNIGVLNAVTAREFARIQLDSTQSRIEVEPLANYSVLRAQKENGGGRLGLGFLATMAQRAFDDRRLVADFNRNSTVLGADGWYFLDQKRIWAFSGWGSYSRIQGDPARITKIQRNPIHYFQRPDADHLTMDSAATVLEGTAGRLTLNKERGDWLFNAALGWISPGYDVNDLGFLSYADVINYHVGSGYRWTKPTKISRYAQLVIAKFGSYNFGGTSVGAGWLLAYYYQFLNYYSIEGNFCVYPRAFNHRATRGGPLMIEPAGTWGYIYLRSDSRKKVVGVLNVEATSDEFQYRYLRISPEIEWKIRSNLLLEFQPEYARQQRGLQYITTVEDPLSPLYGNHYLFGELDQKTLSASFRLNWTFTPYLTWQIYAQPLISTGHYTNLKELKRARSYDFLIYGEEGSTIDYDSYTIDPDGNGPMDSFQIDKPDFNIHSFRLSAVLRWEFAPGSTLYLVWTQNRFEDDNSYRWRPGRSLQTLSSLKPDNILMLKMSYWFTP
jgi:hypothetical protein